MTWQYVARRCGLCVLIVWLALTANFLLPRLATPEISRPRGPVAQQLGMDRPLGVQYLAYLGDLLHLDLSYSMSSYPSRTSDVIASALPWTMALLFTTSMVAWTLGTLIGAVLAWPGRPRIVQFVFPPLLVLGAAPQFLIGMLLLYVFAFRLRMFPLGGGFAVATAPEVSVAFGWNVVQHALLPALAIILGSIATWSITMRALVVSMRGDDFLVFADAKGLRQSTIFLHYAIRNALLPQVTGLGLALGQIVSGALLVEAVFRYPGLGGVLLRAIVTRDYILEQGIVLLIVVSIALVTLVLDLVYPLLDPRLTGARANTVGLRRS